MEAKPLSPAAQAVVDAWDAKLDPHPDDLTYLTHDPEREALAAALRAAADQDETLFDVQDEMVPAVRAVRTDRLLAIAAELEGAQ